MTSRVQKGGPIFRPLAKQRSRPAASQVHSSALTDPSSSISAPAPSHNDLGFSQATTLVESQSYYAAPTAHSMPPSIIIDDTQRRPPSIIASTPILPPHSPPRQSIPPPIVHTTTLSDTNFLSQSIPQLPPPSVLQFAIDPALEAPPENHVLHGSSTANGTVPVPHLTLNVENTLKPPRKPTELDTDLDADADADEDPDVPTIQEGNVEESTPKRKRKPSKKNRAESAGEDSAETRPKRKRKPKKSKEGENEDSNDFDDSQAATSKKRRRSSSSSKPSAGRGRGRKPRSPSVPPFDPNADPGEEIDPTVVTMATLCNDTGQGRVSSKAQEILSNHAAWKAANRERRARMRTLMERKKYGQPEEEPEEGAANEGENSGAGAGSGPGPGEGEASTSAAASASVAPQEKTTGNVDDPDTFDYTQGLTASRFNVQVRIGPNGETIIDEESLVVDRVEVEDDTTGYTHVVESDMSKFVNSGTYGKKFRGSRWSAEETELFYEALAQYGENYELISYVLPGRDRKSCKNKFKAEDKKNPARINHCLNNSIPVDMNTLSRMTGKDFSGPVPEIAVPSPALVPIASENQQRQQSAATASAPDKQVPSKARKRSRSRTAGPSEEGLQVIGDIDSYIDPDKDGE